MNGLKGIGKKYKIIVAYEPVWSIGTGIVPNNLELEKNIKFIKSIISKKFNNCKILYGGSVSPNNIKKLNMIDLLDGYLIGGESQSSKKLIYIILNIILAIILVILVLFQKSEGGALGIGVSQDNFMFSRTAGDFLTKATGIVATLFIICSLSLTIVSRGDLISETSVIDAVEETEDTPKIPDNNN